MRFLTKTSHNCIGENKILEKRFSDQMEKRISKTNARKIISIDWILRNMLTCRGQAAKLSQNLVAFLRIWNELLHRVLFEVKSPTKDYKSFSW